jgi:hypothetical protein
MGKYAEATGAVTKQAWLGLVEFQVPIWRTELSLVLGC